MEYDSNQVFIFYHIMKTGGSSFWHSIVDAAPRQVFIDDIYHRSALASGLEYGSFINDFTSPDWFRLSRDMSSVIADSFGQIPSPKRIFIHHHLPVNVHQLFDEPKYIMALRDPSARFLSFFRHIRARNNPPAILYVPKDRSISGFLKHPPLQEHYRKLITALFYGDSEEKVMDILASSIQQLPSDEEIVELVDRYFVDVLITRGNEFNQAELDEFSRTMMIGSMLCNIKRVEVTKTDSSLVSDKEIEELNEVSGSYFYNENSLLSALDRWRLKRQFYHNEIERKQLLFRTSEFSDKAMGSAMRLGICTLAEKIESKILHKLIECR